MAVKKNRDKVQTINAFDPSHVSMNVNVYRQRDLSAPMVAMLEAAAVIAGGDLKAIKAAAEGGTVNRCRVQRGAFEVEDAAPERVERYAKHAVRIVSPSKRKHAPWIELIYDDADDAAAIIATVNG